MVGAADLSPAYWAAALGVLGSIVGSLAANLCLRWPRGEGVVAGRSKCDACGRVLGARELIPVLSFLARRGRCTSCGAPIDPLHWRVEIAGAAIGIGAALAFGGGAQSFAIAVLGWLLLPLAILDWRHLWLPDRLTLIVAVAGIVFGGMASGASLPSRVVAGIAGYLALSAFAWSYRHVRGIEGMGRGDPKLFGAIGLWVGIAAMPLLLLLSALSGIAVGLILRKADDHAAGLVAFGTMLCLATVPSIVLSVNFF